MNKLQLKGIPFVHRHTVYRDADKPVPLNKYLLDDDCTYVLKRCYCNSSKNELMQDDEIMKNFFGSAKKGKEVLGEMSEGEWNNME